MVPLFRAKVPWTVWRVLSSVQCTLVRAGSRVRTVSDAAFATVGDCGKDNMDEKRVRRRLRLRIANVLTLRNRRAEVPDMRSDYSGYQSSSRTSIPVPSNPFLNTDRSEPR